jgi:hypothetical protein
MYPLAVAELPFWLPSIDTKMIWHEKNQRDPFHAWLRERMAQVDRPQSGAAAPLPRAASKSKGEPGAFSKPVAFDP